MSESKNQSKNESKNRSVQTETIPSILGPIMKLCNQLHEQGVRPEHLEIARKDGDKRVGLAAYPLIHGKYPSVESGFNGLPCIFRDNFTGARELNNLFKYAQDVDLKIYKKDLPAFSIDLDFVLGPCPFQGKNGLRVFETWRVVLDFPANSLELQSKLFPLNGQPRFCPYGEKYADRWYLGQDFYHGGSEKYDLYFLYTGIPFRGATYQDQLKSLEELSSEKYGNKDFLINPQIRIATLVSLTHQRQTGEYIFSDWARVANETIKDSGRSVFAGYRVNVGGFDSDGLRIVHCLPGRCSDDMGLAVARKCRIIAS